MKRYDCYYKDDFGYNSPALSKEVEDGDWVRFEDHEAEIRRLREDRASAIDRLTPLGLENERLRHHLRHIHAAMANQDLDKVMKHVLLAEGPAELQPGEQT